MAFVSLIITSMVKGEDIPNRSAFMAHSSNDLIQTGYSDYYVFYIRTALAYRCHSILNPYRPRAIFVVMAKRFFSRPFRRNVSAFIKILNPIFFSEKQVSSYI